MILRDGLAVSFPVMFPTGNPDGSISWKVRDEYGAVLATGSITVPDDAVSAYVLISSSYNTLTPPALYGSRDVEWSYSVGGAVVNGESRYAVEGRLPYGISADGVRAKLGVNALDLPDQDISLVQAYLTFQDDVGEDEMAAAAATSPAAVLALRDAVEATAALMLIPTMPVRIASAEETPSNKFKRQEIDWEAVGAHLEAIITDGQLVVNPTFDETANYGALFILAGPANDAYTGA